MGYIRLNFYKGILLNLIVQYKDIVVIAIKNVMKLLKDY